MMAFHDVRFPLDIALHSRGGPERRTEIIRSGSGRESRNARWAHSRRRYDAGYGVKSLAALAEVLAFFEERRGRLHGFRWRDRLDNRSCAPDRQPMPGDQLLGQGDGARSAFQLVKTYGAGVAPYVRPIVKPVAQSLRLAVGGVERAAGSDFDLDAATGLVVFRPGRAPASGVDVTAGFVFDVPVRFDADYLEIDLAAFEAGEIPGIPIVEILP